jgi:hypothetical protein
MKKALILLTTILLTSCAEREQVLLSAVDGKDGTSCILQDTVLNCGGVLLDLAPKHGHDGRDGLNGLDGSSCSVVSIDGGLLLSCAGSEGFIPSGTNGSSCYVDEAEGGAIVWCEDGSSVFIRDGKDAESEEEDDSFSCKAGKVLVCHTTPKTPKNLCVAAPALPAFIETQEGYEGPCE